MSRNPFSFLSALSKEDQLLTLLQAAVVKQGGELRLSVSDLSDLPILNAGGNVSEGSGAVGDFRRYAGTDSRTGCGYGQFWQCQHAGQSASQH